MESEEVKQKAIELRDILYDIISVITQTPKEFLEDKIFKEDLPRIGEEFREAMTSKLPKFSEDFIKIIFLKDLIKAAKEALEQAVVFLIENGVRINVPYTFDNTEN